MDHAILVHCLLSDSWHGYCCIVVDACMLIVTVRIDCDYISRAVALSCMATDHCHWELETVGLLLSRGPYASVAQGVMHIIAGPYICDLVETLA